MEVYKGIAVCGGIAVGNVYLHYRRSVTIPGGRAPDPKREWARFLVAHAQANEQLGTFYTKALETVGPEQADIFEAHRQMLADQDFLDAVRLKIERDGENAARAVHLVGKELAAAFEALDDSYIRARAADVQDIASMLVDILLGVTRRELLLAPSVVVADDIAPSELMQMDKSRILAIVTRRGSANSHMAILACTMGIPTVTGADVPITEENDGKPCAVDGYAGTCYLEPNESTLGMLEQKRLQAEAERLACEEMRGLPSVTRGGRRVSICANIGGSGDIDAVLENDAEGVGLLRSEFLYMGRKHPPGEQEQYAVYRDVAERLGGKRVVVRTMDIGADKRVDYLDLPPEENPAMGYRALRVCLDRPALFQAQLRAICRAAACGNVAVMFPMVTSEWEVEACKKALWQAQADLEKAGIPFARPATGVMIETPAAVMICDELAALVDFFSVGTNDLIQYTLAADRQNASLTRYADPRHPAVMRMLEQVAKSAAAHGIPAGICGELAGDLTMTGALVEMGYTELSVQPRRVLALRRAVRAL